MPNIKIKEIEPLPNAVFEVTIEADEPTVHQVSMTHNYYHGLTNGNISPKKLIKKSFEFLLERESNASILSEFGLREISNYFPEYKETIASMLKQNNDQE